MDPNAPEPSPDVGDDAGEPPPAPRADTAETTPAPPEALEEAVLLTRQRAYVRALELFEDHLAPLQASGSGKALRRYLSYYGVCLAMVHGQTRKALRLCEDAIEACDPEADLFLNLGLVHLRGRRRDLARAMFREGLSLDPAHAGLLATVQRMKRRRRPVFPFLERKHPLNRVGGRVMNRVHRALRGGDPGTES